MSSAPVATPQPPSRLVHQWTVAGLVASSARFIPIPFVDDLVREQCYRFVVSRTLAIQPDAGSMDDWKLYYTTGGGCISGCVAKLLRAPLKLLLFPIRKIVTVLTSVRGVPLEIMRTVLLGRTLHRLIVDRDRPPTAAEAAQMRRAFEEAFARMDFRIVRATMIDALRSVSGWKSAAIQMAKRIARTDQIDDEAIRTEPSVEDGATRVQNVLERPETLELFAAFDRRFDETLRLETES